MIVDQDDWRGVTDPAERKKRQNRLRQRLARKYSSIFQTWNYQANERYNEIAGSLNRPCCAVRYARLIYGQARRKGLPPMQSLSPVSIPLGMPTPPLIFPLSPDHCLLTMVQYNVQRASLFNMAVLSLLEHLPLECGGTLNLPSLAIDPPRCVPPELLPTALQKSTPHEYWIDIFPCPVMRDNLIRLYSQYDAHDLHLDLAKSLYEGFVDGEQRGCMVWGEPWTVNGWEVSEGFVRKWGFLLKGCSGLLASTNRWRESRGEDALTTEV
ncbi:uncharacterized protein TRIVIDRAFT_119702 [Trichoderma virens Gv29-8]